MSKWTETILPRWNKEFEKDPTNFLRADRRRNNQTLANKYWDEMSSSEYFTKEILPQLPKETVGNPFRFNKYEKICPQTVQHLYHLFTMKTKTKFEPHKQADVIIEFGGGYGNLCRLAYTLGFTGKYILVDFADQLEKQKWFLNECGIDISKVLFLTMDRLEEVYDLLKENKSVLVGTYSISEMPLADRQKIEPLYPFINYIFIVYKAKEFDGVNNDSYFDNLATTELNNTFTVDQFSDRHYGKSTFLIASKETE